VQSIVLTRIATLGIGAVAAFGCSDVNPITSAGEPGAATTAALSTPSTAANVVRRMGLKRDSNATISAHMKPAAPPPSGLPATVMLTSQVPPPGDQQDEGSCTGWAVAYAAKSFQEVVEEAWSPTALNHQFSPSFIYNQTNDGVDMGAWPSDALNLVVSKGADTMTSFPYVNGDYVTQPTAASFEHAAHFLAKSWSTLPISESSFKSVLAAHNIVIVAFDVLPDYMSLNATTNTVYDDDAGGSLGGHVNALIGYDDSLQAFRFINSWGTNWGDAGYGWLAYSMITSAKLNLNAYVLVDGPNTAILGDADGNLCVDNADYQLLVGSYGACKPSAKYDYRTDFNNDGCVNMKDYQLWASRRGEGC